ncbi:LppX_LprAFG lipoprotein [Nocardia inohanensis]|uniref:LppX_LprAFG lipoprotein n=1 Tax=Nocardia inohanensis TaxID=209246 RepID=UPI00082BC107|nr:LppX_LprAFG lipoprotein [Nocardia inohanensis]
MNDVISQGNISTGRRLRRRGAAAIIAAGLLVTFAAGCSSSDDKGGSTSSSVAANTPLPEGAQIVQESARTTQTLQAVHLALTAKDLSTLPVKSVKADVTNQPQGAGQAIGEAEVKLKPEAEYTSTKFLVVDKTLYAGDGSAYSKVGPAEQVYDPGIILDKDKGLANVIAKIQNPKAEAREKVNGVDSVKVSGTIDASVIDPVVPKLGEGGGTLPITVWIKDVAPPSGTATTLPSTAASPGTGPNLVQAVVKKDNGTVTVTLSDWGKPVTVTKPGS